MAGERSSRACIRCRRQKIKCNLSKFDRISSSGCDNCLKAGIDCVPATSNRGGARQRRNTTQANEVTNPESPGSRVNGSHVAGRRQANLGLSRHMTEVLPDRDEDGTAIDDAVSSSNLHSTSRVLNLVQSIKIAANATGRQCSTSDVWSDVASQSLHASLTPGAPSADYFLVSSGLLTFPQVARLLGRFAEVYHPHYPIAPREALSSENLVNTACYEPTLLTAMITIAAQDIRGDDDCILRNCAQYMQVLVGEIMLGKHCKVEAVEAMLLLAEWEPQFSICEPGTRSCGGEDVAAFMHVGLALRIASLLEIESGFLRGDSKKSQDSTEREALACVACFLSDRQISIRTGRSFGFRGPEPGLLGRRLSLATAHDQNSSDNEDYIKILEARLEMTLIYSNVHQVLYCRVNSNSRMMLHDTYASYLDDFHTAILGWKSTWGALDCSAHVKIQLDLSFEYLRLYTNAFVFQARNSNAVDHENNIREHAAAGLSPDTRFIYEALDAAKAFLTTLNDHISPGDSFNHLPIRFLLYTVNCAVFLKKVLHFKTISEREIQHVPHLVRGTITRLQQSSVRPSDLAAQYGHLLELLWNEKGSVTRKRGSIDQAPEAPSFDQPNVAEECYNSPDAFSWVNSEARGDFLSTDFFEGLGFQNGDIVRGSDSDIVSVYTTACH